MTNFFQLPPPPLHVRGTLHSWQLFRQLDLRLYGHLGYVIINNTTIMHMVAYLCKFMQGRRYAGLEL